MKRRVLSILLTVTCLSLSAAVPSFAAETDSRIQVASNAFYNDLHEMIDSQDALHYFGKAEMHLGDEYYIVDGKKTSIQPIGKGVEDDAVTALQILAELSGSDFQYDQKTTTLSIGSDVSDVIRYRAGDSNLSIGGSTVSVGTAGEAAEDLDYEVLHAVADALLMCTERNSQSGTITITAPYQTARLLAWTDSLDTAGLHAKKVINDGDGLWLLQFNSPLEAYYAHEVLDKRGIVADPDGFLPTSTAILGGSGMQSLQVNPGSFYSDLHAMISSQDTSHFFGKIEMKLGSETYTVDGRRASVNPLPGARNDGAVIGMQVLAEASGEPLSYDARTASVSIGNSKNSRINYSIGASSLSIGGAAVSVGAPGDSAEKIDYLLISAAADALDMETSLNEKTNVVTLTAPYQTCRIIVWADTVDTSGLNASKVITDGSGIWILQFNSAIEARFAHEQLTKKGLVADPDGFVPSINAKGNISVAGNGNSHSWGVEACHFRDFINANASRMSGSSLVAVIDSGIDAKHPLLKGRVTSGYDFIDNDTDPYDEHGHGTHVSGIVIDCVGTAPVSILPVRVMDAEGRGSHSTIVVGMKYAVDNGADVINLSIGGTHNDVLDQVIDYAVQKGCAVVIAAGNESENTSEICPGHMTLPGTIIVSAGDKNKSKASFSNYGNSVDIMAPGVDVNSSLPGNEYASWQGTSMAAPHVAAAAALLDLVYGEQLSPSALEDKVHTATSHGSWTNANMGFGFLDMSKADVSSGSSDSPKLPFTDADKISHKDAVSLLVQLGVITGFPDKSFRPNNTLTRAEACAILSRLMGYTTDASVKAPFKDTKGHWGERYIGACAERGIVIGYGDGNFGPEDKLTGAAWEKMMLAAVGYNPEATGMIGSNWQIGVGELSSATGLEDGIVGFNAAKEINRDNACQIAYNSLQ